MADSKPRSAAVYVRISKADRDPVTGALSVEKVEDQEARCRKWAKENGWQIASFIPDQGEAAPKRRNGKGERPSVAVPTVPGLYSDNDASASKARPRPQWEVLLRDARAGRVDGILAVDADRLTRKPDEFETLIKLHDERGVQLATLGGEYDLTDPADIFRVRVMGNVAALEVMTKARRQRRMNEARALRGEQYGGMKGDSRPFGWEDGGMVVRQAEADQIASAMGELLKGADGDNFRSIVVGWNSEGLPTARGGAWTLTSARQVLLRWRNAGIIHRNGQPIKDTQGNFVEGNWEKIVEPDILLAVRDLFEGRKQGKQRLTGQYLLSNIALCGRDGCGSTLRHGLSRQGKRVEDTYRCNQNGGGSSCGLGITREILDETVIDHVATTLSLPNSALMSQTSADLASVKKLREDKARLEAEANEVMADGSVSRKVRMSMVAEIEAELRDVESDLTRLRSRDALAALLLDLTAFGPNEPTPLIPAVLDRAKEVRARFEALDLGARRTVVKALFQSITVEPHPKGVKGTAQSARNRIVITGLDGAVWRWHRPELPNPQD